MYGSMEPWNLFEKTVIKQKSVVSWFHGTVEHMEPQFVNLMLSNNASQVEVTVLSLQLANKI